MRMDYHHYSEETCDVMLEVEGVHFPVHQQVMLDLSPTFFSDLFSKGPTESSVYMVHNVASYIMRPIIQYAYSRQITITETNVKDLLAAAEYLSVSDIVQLCEEFLEKQHCEEDRCETTELPTTQSCPDLLPSESSLLYEPGVSSPPAFDPITSPPIAFEPNATPPIAFEPNATPPTEEAHCETSALPTTQFYPDLLTCEWDLLYELGISVSGVIEPNATPPSAFEPNATPPSAFEPNAGPPIAFEPNATPTSAFEQNATPPSAFEQNATPPIAFKPNATPPTEEAHCETSELPTTQFYLDLLPWERDLLYELGISVSGVLEPNATPPSAFEQNATPPSAFEQNATPPSAFEQNATPPIAFEPNATPPTEEAHCETSELPTTQFYPDLLPCEWDLLYELGISVSGALEPNATPPSAFEPNAIPPSAFEPNATPPSALEPNATPPSAFEPNATSPSAYAPTTYSPGAYGPSAHAPSAAPSSNGQFVSAPYAQSPLFYCHRQKHFVSRPCHTPYLRPSVRIGN